MDAELFLVPCLLKKVLEIKKNKYTHAKSCERRYIVKDLQSVNILTLTIDSH